MDASSEAGFTTLPAHEDAISGVRFGPQNRILSSSWDNSLAVTTVGQTKLALRATFQAPLLGCCWGAAGDTAYAGGVERRVGAVDLGTGKIRDVGGDHGLAISCITSDHPGTTVISGSFDGSIQHIDVRKEAGIFYKLGRKVFSIDLVGHTLVVAMADKMVNSYDTRKLSEPLLSRQLYYDHPLRTVRVMPSAKGYAVSSVKSRVTIEMLPDLTPTADNAALSIRSPALEFSFRSNRQKIAGDDREPTFRAFPINALAFHPHQDTIACGGSDKTIQVWDIKRRHKVAEFGGFPYSVAQLDYSWDGQYLAAAIIDDSYRMSPAQSSRKLPATLLVKDLGLIG